jgi:hypothetical protein
MREWWENWRYEWRDWLESGMWRLSMAAMAGLALIFAGWNWAPHATFEIMRIGMGLGAIAFLAVMAWFFVTKVWTKVFRPVWLNWKAITAEARLNAEAKSEGKKPAPKRGDKPPYSLSDLRIK